MIAERRLSGVFGYILGSGVAVQILMVISTIVLSRLYGPAPFGVLAFYAGIASVYSVISGFRFDYLAFGASRDLAFFYYVVALVLSLLLVPVITFIALAVLPLVKNGTSLSNVVIFCFSASLFYLGTQYLVARGDYRRFARFRVCQVLGQFFIGFVGYYCFPNIGLLYAFAISQFCVGAFILFSCSSAIKAGVFVKAYGVFNNMKKRASVHTVLVAMQYSTPFAPVLIGGMYFSAAELGGYFVMAQFFSGPFSVFRRSAINFLNGEMADRHLAVGLLESYKRRLFLALIVVVVIAVAGLLVLFFVSETLVSIVLGNQWLEFASLLSPVFVFFFLDAVFQPITTLLPLWGYERRAISYEAFRFCLVFLMLPLLVYLYDLVFYEFIVVYFLAMLLCYFLIALDVYRKLSGCSRSE